MSDNNREEFEAWVTASGRASMLQRDKDHGWYKDLTVTAWWTAWQAARAQPERVALSDVTLNRIWLELTDASVISKSAFLAAVRKILAAQADLNPCNSVELESSTQPVIAEAARKCTCCGTTENLHPDLGSGGPYRCNSPNCIVF